MADVPEPHCFAILRVFPEYGLGEGGEYIWDMNGVPTEVGEITGMEEELDSRFRAWAKKYDSQPSDDKPFTHSEEERLAFDEEGMALARELFIKLGGSSSIVYIALDGTKTLYEKKA